MIERFEGRYAFLSNFHPWGFNFRGFWMPTAEHAFQAFKSENPYDMVYVASAPTPGKAKYRGRSVQLRSDWDDVKLPLMLEIVQTKFTAPERRDALLATCDTGMVEGNYWHDQFWGNCMCNQHPEPGRNYLGRILMHVRKQLRG